LRKNLWVIDLALIGLIFFTWTNLRDRWAQAEQREQVLMRRSLPQLAVPFIPALANVGPVTSSAYNEVAQQFLFSRDRNPNVILDPPPPPPAPKPMPDLPLAYGVIDLGAGPTIMLAEKSGALQRGYRVGEVVGAFKILALNSHDISLQWEDKIVNRKIEEIVDKNAMKASTPPPQGNAPPISTQPQVTQLAPVKTGPGVELGEKTRACQPGDTSPAGTVRDGYRKSVNKTPFGESCRWESVN